MLIRTVATKLYGEGTSLTLSKPSERNLKASGQDYSSVEDTEVQIRTREKSGATQRRMTSLRPRVATDESGGPAAHTRCHLHWFAVAIQEGFSTQEGLLTGGHELHTATQQMSGNLRCPQYPCTQGGQVSLHSCRAAQDVSQYHCGRRSQCYLCIRRAR